jgi:leucyl-tRNA synthetase
VPADTGEEAIKTQALALEKVVAHLKGEQPRQVIYVPGRLVNIVV